jgi:hypothetical protein
MTTAKKPVTRSKKKAAEDKNVFVTEKGLEIELRKIDPIFVQSAVNSVNLPEPPTYEARTSSGRIETHTMDKESAEQTEGGMEIWKTYQEEYGAATLEKANRSLRAIFLDGTVVPQGEWMDKTWERRMRIVGITLPSDEEELWITYLLSWLTAEDINNLTTEIMRLTGIDEEYIESAQESFQSSVLSEQE